MQGKLIVEQAKKGLVAKISWTDEASGEEKRMPIGKTPNLSLDMDGKTCEFQRVEGGKIVSVKVDGKEVLGQRPPQPVRQPQRPQHSRPQRTGFGGGQRSVAPDAGEVYDVNAAKLPSDTQNLLRSRGIDNFALQLQKAAPYLMEQTNRGEKDVGFKVYHRDRKRVLVNFDPDFDAKQIAALVTRRQSVFAKLASGIYDSFSGTVDWRLVVGLGNESVYETSMTLHHIYGFPYIPGSALKGVARHWALREYYANDESKALQDKRFEAVFGFTTQDGSDAEKGCIVFHDAYPNKPPEIAPDIMNPHYGPYYSDPAKNPPADYHSPVPITFLTVKGGSFDFYLSLGQPNRFAQAYPELDSGAILQTAKSWLREALQNSGVGAKTAVGYGYWNVR